jgi:hypothetical protein
MKVIFPCLFLLLPLWCCAQSARDTILAKERSIDRPLTLHRGQLRIEGGYGLSAVTRRFDLDGDKIHLRDEGRSFVQHQWLVDVRYGLLENLTLIFSTNFRRQSERTEQVLTVTDEVTELFEIKHRTGMEDPLLALSARAPFTSPALDIILTGGMYLPVSTYKEKVPDHKIEDVGYRSIVYNYYQKWGNGVLVGVIGGNLKYRGQDFAFTGSFLYNHPLGVTENVQWQHQLVNNQFQYQQQSYQYQLPNRIHFSVELEQQLSPWFVLTAILSGDKTTGGWNEVNGVRYTWPGQAFYSINPGYEILVTPKIWLRQRMILPVLGQATDAPFSIYSSLVYNFFPFN